MGLKRGSHDQIYFNYFQFTAGQDLALVKLGLVPQAGALQSGCHQDLLPARTYNKVKLPVGAR